MSVAPEIPISYEVLFDNLAEGAVVIDLDNSEITRCNQAFAEMLGQEPELIATCNLLSLLPADQPDGSPSTAAVKNLVESALRGESGPFELEHRHSSGKLMDLQVTAISIPESENLFFFIYRNLTDLKEAVEHSDLNQQRFETIFKQAPISITIATADDQILSVNPQFSEFLGYSQEEILGKTFSDITHPDDRKRSLELHNHMVAHKGERFKMAKRYLRKDGSYVWGQSVATAMYDDDGNPTVVLSMQQDIDELKNAQSVLQEQGSFLRSITENLNEGVIVVSADGKLKYANQACKEFTGVETVDVVVADWSSKFGIYEPDEVTPFPQDDRPLMRALKGETVYGVPLFIKQTSYGFGRHVLMDAVPMRDSDGSIEQAMGVFRDISDIRTAEQQIEEGAERMKALVESVPDMILRLDGDGKCLYYKENSKVRLSFDPAEALGRPMNEFMPEGGYDLHFPYVQKAIETGEVQQYEYDNVVDGELRYYEARVVKASEDEVVVFVRDFTDRRADRLDLIQKQEQLLGLVDAWPDLLFQLTADGEFMDYKAERSEELMLPPEEFLGKKIRDVFPEDMADFFMYQIKKARAQDEVRVFEYKVPLKNEVLDYEGRIVKMGEEQVVFFGRNITKRKKQESELQEVNRQLEVQAAELLELNKDLEHYAYYAAHDIRGPMNNINTLLMMIREQNGVRPESEMLFEKAEQAVEEMKRIVEALNDVIGLKKSLQVQSGGSVISDTVDRVLIGLNELIDGNNVKIETILDGENNSIVASVHLYSVLQNLVMNAIRYQRAGVRNKIIIRSAVKDEMLEISVKDNGMGIDLEANRGKIFRMFKRFHDHVPGRGIGLYMVKSIVESYGGTIDVESEVNVGTEFIIRLPRK